MDLPCHNHKKISLHTGHCRDSKKHPVDAEGLQPPPRSSSRVRRNVGQLFRGKIREELRQGYAGCAMITREKVLSEGFAPSHVRKYMALKEKVSTYSGTRIHSW